MLSCFRGCGSKQNALRDCAGWQRMAICGFSANRTEHTVTSFTAWLQHSCTISCCPVWWTEKGFLKLKTNQQKSNIKTKKQFKKSTNRACCFACSFISTMYLICILEIQMCGVTRILSCLMPVCTTLHPWCYILSMPLHNFSMYNYIHTNMRLDMDDL